MSRTRNLKGFLIVPVGTVESFSIKAGYGFVKLDNGEVAFLNTPIFIRPKNSIC